MRATACVVALGMLVGCGGSDTPREADVARNPNDDAVADSWAKKPEPPPPVRNDPLPELAKAPTCMFDVDVPREVELGVWEANDGYFDDLRATGTVRVLMNVDDGMAEVTSRSADGAGFVVRGRLRARFHLKRDAAGPVVTIGTEPAVSVKSIRGQQAVVTTPGSAHLERAETPDDRVASMNGKPRQPMWFSVPEVTVGCDALSFDARPASLASDLALASDKRVAVSAKPKDDPVLWYGACVDCASGLGGRASPPERPKAEFQGAPVEVLETIGQRKRVRFLVDGLFVEGWVDATMVGKRTGAAYTRPKDREKKREPKGPVGTEVVRCDRDLQIYVTARQGQPVRVGTVFAGTRVQLGLASTYPEGLRTVAVDGLEIPDRYDVVSFYAPVGELARCKP